MLWLGFEFGFREFNKKQIEVKIIFRIKNKEYRMRRPKGFGKTYFSLSAILAYSVEPLLHAKTSTFTSLIHCHFSQEDELEEDDPPNILENLIAHTQKKPCHCNCFFKLKTRLILMLHHYIPRCPYYTTYFAYRRTGVHPPLASFN